MKKSLYGWIELFSGIFLACMGVYTLFAPQTLINGTAVFYGLMMILVGIADWMLYIRLKDLPNRVWPLVSGMVNIVLGVLLVCNLGNPGGGIPQLFLVALLLHSVGRLLVKNQLASAAGESQGNVTLWTNLLCAACCVIALFARLSTAWPAIGMVLLAIDSFYLTFGKLGQQDEPVQKSAAAS